MSAEQLLVEIAKHVIAIASSLIALSVTFAKNLGNGALSPLVKCALTSWLAAVVASLWILLALTAHLSRAPHADIWSLSIRVPSFVQLISLALGLGLFMLHALTVKAPESAAKPDWRKKKRRLGMWRV
jgi:hypothetical protein